MGTRKHKRQDEIDELSNLNLQHPHFLLDQMQREQQQWQNITAVDVSNRTSIATESKRKMNLRTTKKTKRHVDMATMAVVHNLKSSVESLEQQVAMATYHIQQLHTLLQTLMPEPKKQRCDNSVIAVGVA